MKRTHVQEVVGRFFPDHQLAALFPFGTGNINDTFKAELAGRGPVLVQRINHQVFRRPRQVMENVQRVFRHLARYDDMHCLLEPLALPDGKLLYEDAQGNFWRAFPFFEHKESPERVDQPEQAYRASASIGRFLARLLDLDPQAFHHTIPGFHDSLSRYDYFQDQVRTDPAHRLARVGAEVEAVRRHHGIFQEVVDLDLPQRVVHNDTKISNVLFDQASGEACGLIDWDTIMPGSILSDFGDMVRSFVSPVEEDYAPAEAVTIRMPIFEALCRGFVPELEGRAEPKELDHLVLGALWITLEQAMRFLADYLAGDPYYKVAYPEHNLVRTHNQLALFDQLYRQRDALEKVLWRYRSL